jgi:hypothetical protein
MLKIWKICLLVMFILEIFSGVILCIVGLRFCQYHLFWIINSEWSTNYTTGREGPMLFILKVWSQHQEGVGFYTTSSPESVRETFMHMKNPTRDEPVHKKVMSKFLKDIDQVTPAQGDSCTFIFFGNVCAPLMATLNILGLNVRLSIWLWPTLNVLNALDSSQISTLFHGHRMDVDSSLSSSINFTPSPSPSSGESLATNTQKSKRNRKRKSKKKKSPNSASHIGYMSPTSTCHVGGKKPSIVLHVGTRGRFTVIHTSIISPTSMRHVGDRSKTLMSHVEKKKLTSTSHIGSESLVTDSHIGQTSPTYATQVGDQHLATTSHPRGNPPATASHVGGIDMVEKPRHIECKPKFPCNLCKGYHLTHLCLVIIVV